MTRGAISRVLPPEALERALGPRQVPHRILLLLLPTVPSDPDT